MSNMKYNQSGKVYLYHDLTIPAVNNTSIPSMLSRMLHNTNKWNRQDISNCPDTTLLTQRGLLIAHSLIDSSTKQLTTMIANISDNTVELKNFNR